MEKKAGIIIEIDEKFLLADSPPNVAAIELKVAERRIFVSLELRKFILSKPTGFWFV